MQMVSVDDALARIMRAHAGEPEGVAAFDADGTLWSIDVGDELLAAMLEADAFGPTTDEAIASECERADIAPSGTRADSVRRLLACYHQGTYPEERLLEVIAWGLAGRTRDEVSEIVAGVVARLDMPRHDQGETLAALAGLRERGVEVFVVSASPRAIVEAAVRRLGVDESHVVAVTPVYESGRMRASVLRPTPYGAGKVAALRQHIGERPLLGAFGDNHFDAPMLRASRHPFAVRPKPRLRAIADTIPELNELIPVR